jgi:hypothetical protein
MMKQPVQERSAGRDSEDSLPAAHPCYGCPYAKVHPCIGYCLKELMKKKNA